ncbi:unnamed protein product [Heterobilharzia americana]|nr:unnamed protein product [Heterobilharzia americana]
MQTEPMTDSEGKLVTKEEKQRKQWVDHFNKLLNRPPPATRPEIPPATAELPEHGLLCNNRNSERAVKLPKSGKAAVPDGIPPESMKSDVDTSVDILIPLLQKVWKEGQIPAN